MTQFLKRLLNEAEAEHRKAGLPKDTWAGWYAAYMSPRLAEWHMATYGTFGAVSCPFFAAQQDVRNVDGITEG